MTNNAGFGNNSHSSLRFFTPVLRTLAVAKRYVRAGADALRPTKTSYSQYGEDVVVWQGLANHDLSFGAYVEVGANQPTQISNTYLFYRHGYSGVLVEPNRDLISLLRRFRPRDIVIQMGCAKRPGILEFKHHRASVLSTFVDDIPGDMRISSEFVAVLPLDEVLSSLRLPWIYYLSIDTEGFDLLVLEGAERSLEKTFFVSVECKENQLAIDQFLADRGFSMLLKTPENSIFKNANCFLQFQKGTRQLSHCTC